MTGFTPTYNHGIDELPLDFSLLSYPEDIFGEEGNLFMNHEYTDLRGWSDWGLTKIIIDQERELLKKTSVQAHNHDEFEGLMQEEEEDINYYALNDIPVEYGIVSITSALIAADVVPIESCRGHSYTSHTNNYPHVFFFARKDEARRLDNLIRQDKDVYFANAQGDDQGLVIYSETNLALVDFAEKMLEAYK